MKERVRAVSRWDGWDGMGWDGMIKDERSAVRRMW